MICAAGVGVATPAAQLAPHAKAPAEPARAFQPTEKVE